MKARDRLPELDRNKLRLFELMERCIRLKSLDVSFEMLFDMELHTQVRFRLFEYKKSSMSNDIFNTHEELEEILDLKSEDWEFTSLSDRLSLIEQYVDVQRAKQRKKDAVLRKLSAAEREALGILNWVDPEPELKKLPKTKKLIQGQTK